MEEQTRKGVLLEKESSTLVERMRSMNEAVDNKAVQGEKVAAKLIDTQRDIASMQSYLGKLDVDMNEIERMNDRYLDH